MYNATPTNNVSPLTCKILLNCVLKMLYETSSHLNINIAERVKTFLGVKYIISYDTALAGVGCLYV